MADYKEVKVLGMAAPDSADMPMVGGEWTLSTKPSLTLDQLPIEFRSLIHDVMEGLAAGGFESATIEFKNLAQQRELQKLRGD